MSTVENAATLLFTPRNSNKLSMLPSNTPEPPGNADKVPNKVENEKINIAENREISEPKKDKRKYNSKHSKNQEKIERKVFARKIFHDNNIFTSFCKARSNLEYFFTNFILLARFKPFMNIYSFLIKKSANKNSIKKIKTKKKYFGKNKSANPIKLKKHNPIISYILSINTKTTPFFNFTLAILFKKYAFIISPIFIGVAIKRNPE